MLEEIRRCFLPREADSHKGSYGTVLSVCGSYGMAGAALLTATAALRCGAGLVRAALPNSIYPIVATRLPEAVYVPYETAGVAVAEKLQTQRTDAMVIGCGLGQSVQTAEMIAALLNEAHCPVILDADGINLAARHIVIPETKHVPLILTPHPMEMARLMGCSVEEVQRDRETVAQRAAVQWDAIVVLKGHRTVIAAPNGEVWINTTGNAGMAVGGSGDVLAGMIASFVAQGMTPWDAAKCGVYLHGMAGDRAAQKLSQHAMLPTDMIDELSALFLKLEQQE